jgi:TonB-dependent SusC/RagA subfamily outer membrane receptor
MPIDPGPGGFIGINPEDVASIEVFKDASTTSMYGVRGANGVVVITTKQYRSVE